MSKKKAKAWLATTEQDPDKEWYVIYKEKRYHITPAKLTDKEFTQQVIVSHKSTVKTRLDGETGRTDLTHKVQSAIERGENKQGWNEKWTLWQNGMPRGAEILPIRPTTNAVIAGD